MLQWGVVGATPGYSSTPQIRKLGITPGARVAVDGAPDGWSLEAPQPVLDAGAGDGPVDVLLRFVRSAAELADVPDLGRRIFPDGALWIAWPRRAAGHVSDVTDDVIRAAVLPLGWWT